VWVVMHMVDSLYYVSDLTGLDPTTYDLLSLNGQSGLV
jgi:hypothetical protein